MTEYKPTELQLARIKNKQCVFCGKPLVNAVDSITNKISKYLWKYECGCIPENCILCIG